jgi:hypothetical protein
MFLTPLDTKDRADRLPVRRLAVWPNSVGDCARQTPAALIARRKTAPHATTGEDSAAHAHVIRSMISVLTSPVEQIRILEAQIAERLAVHTDAQRGHRHTDVPETLSLRRGARQRNYGHG